MTEKLVCLAGGVGAAKFLQGLVRVFPEENVTVIANTGDELTAQIAAAGVLVLPWNIYLPGSNAAPELLAAIADSPARKLLLPQWLETWDWAGVERSDEQALTRHVVKALKQILAGESVRAGRGLGAGAIVAITLGSLVLFVMITSILSAIAETFSF